MSSALQQFTKANLVRSGCKSSARTFKNVPFHKKSPLQLLGYLGATCSLYLRLISTDLAEAYFENGS